MEAMLHFEKEIQYSPAVSIIMVGAKSPISLCLVAQDERVPRSS